MVRCPTCGSTSIQATSHTWWRFDQATEELKVATDLHFIEGWPEFKVEVYCDCDHVIFSGEGNAEEISERLRAIGLQQTQAP